ncbi:hypothetical protein NS206_18330, partial [Microbacterium testaceum]|uniref:RICIN domain-containing protein n=1 Tax=Microbacterium testaceum TaxID=2033 RepID=UPI00079664C7
AQASNGRKVGNINNAGSAVQFTVRVPAAGQYTLNVRYDNGSGSTSSHGVSVNGGTSSTISYPATVDWGRYAWAQKTVTLTAGTNTIRFTKGTGFAELDTLHLWRSGTLDPQFQIVNRNSGKLLEVASASLADGATVGQWGPTENATQRWTLRPTGSATQIVNVNSGKLLEIPGAATADGVDAAPVSYTPLTLPTIFRLLIFSFSVTHTKSSIYYPPLTILTTHTVLASIQPASSHPHL